VTPARHFTEFGKYQIIRKLGRSMSDVYLALDPGPNRQIVLKIVEQCRDAVTQLIVDAERRGAAIQQQLHAVDPRILEIYEFGEQNGCFFVAMEHAEGRSLADILRLDGRMDAVAAARITAEICSQLAVLHSYQVDLDGQRRAIVHGDIKPSNIQIGPHGEVRLLDFGIAKAISATRNLTHHDLGSPAYCSPERLKNSQVDPHADLWALGICLYEMIAGLPPYQAQTTRKLEALIQSRRPPRDVPDGCPPSLRAIIWKALAGECSRRYVSASTFEKDLRSFLARKRTVAESETQPAWDTNATVEKARPSATLPSRKKLVSSIAPLWTQLKSVRRSLLAGLVVGFFIFVPAIQVTRFWNDSAPLREERDYSRAGAATIESDWRLYQRLERDYRWLGTFSPVTPLAEALRSRLRAAADRLFTTYRNSSDPDLASYDWKTARLCLRRLIELDSSDPQLKGKLALSEGYLALAANQSSAQPAFQQAAELLADSPDPHLALARLHVYQSRNVGLAIAEFRAAERLGFRLGPRELEQQGDAFRARAEQHWKRLQGAKAEAEQRRVHALLRRDLERARQVYEPIAGYGKVDASLEQLDRAGEAADRLQATRDRERQAARRYARYRRWR
jgi:serine/threonine protein kinase